MALNLFDGSDNDDVSKIEIDEEFARRYDHNKKREDLQRFEELKKKGTIDSDTDTEEEEEVFDSRNNDLKFFDALIKVRKQDPVLRNKEAKLFESEDEEEENEGEENKKEKKKKPMYLKDVTAKHLIEEGPDFEEREERRKKSYAEEQEMLQNEFFSAAEDALDGVGDDGEEFFKVKKDNGKEEDENIGRIDKKLDEYFGDDDKLDEDEMFLKDYFRKKLWLDNKESGRNGNGKGLDAEGFVGISEDEKEIEKQEDYEREFNFRFEENAGDRVMGFSRVVEGSVRKKDNARKLQRKNKEERLAQAEFERKEELKHLKNLKKKEMNEKLKKIRETAGIGDDEVCLLDEDDLEEEFDPEEYDRKMKKAFDDKYYEANDAESDFGSDSELEKPDFDKEDELLGLPKGWDDDLHGSGDGFSAARERALKRKVDNPGDSEQDEQAREEEGTVLEEGKWKKKQKRSKLEEEVLNKELEEYYKLDYEDTIGDLKTRFKYRPVNSRKYGLSTKEILLSEDKELNEYVSLKKLATYIDKDHKVSSKKRYEQKQRLKSLLEDLTANGGTNAGRKNSINNGKRSTKLLDANKSETPQAEVQNNDQNGLSRNSRKKHQQAHLKLTTSRHLAYGRNSSRSTQLLGANNSESPQPEVQNNDQNGLSRKSKRKRRQAELKLPHARRLAYGINSSQPKSKEKSKAQ